MLDGVNDEAAAWVDYDNDGWLDLYVAGTAGSANRLYRNNLDDGRFLKVRFERGGLPHIGAVVSFDLNYRAKLWNIWGGQEKAVSTLSRIAENVDVLVGNEEDLQLGLGLPEPKTSAKSKLDPAAFLDRECAGGASPTACAALHC